MHKEKTFKAKPEVADLWVSSLSSHTIFLKSWWRHSTLVNSFSKYSCSMYLHTKTWQKAQRQKLVRRHAFMFISPSLSLRKCSTCINVKAEWARCLKGWWSHRLIITVLKGLGSSGWGSYHEFRGEKPVYWCHIREVLLQQIWSPPPKNKNNNNKNQTSSNFFL